MSCISILLTSCSTTNQVASSFGKRKYMKGYYVNLPSANKAIVASNQAPLIPTKSEIVKTESQVLLNLVSASLAKVPLQASSIAHKLRGNNEKKITPVTTISTTGNTNLALTTKKQTEQASTLSNSPGITEYHHGDGGGGNGGDSSLDWAAVVGFVLAFFFSLLGLIFSIIGLKSTLHGLAVAGVILSAIFLLLTIIIIGVVLSAAAVVAAA
jgi:hypothetical protein